MFVFLAERNYPVGLGMLFGDILSVFFVIVPWSFLAYGIKRIFIRNRSIQD